MIRKIPYNKNAIPHIANIINIHSNMSIINSINEYKPLFAGGYPMALLFAPRRETNALEIAPGYFSDYDMYFQSKKDFESALEVLKFEYTGEAGNTKKDYYISESISTDNAVTLIMSRTQRLNPQPAPLVLQLIRSRIAPPEELLSTFDFTNCAIGFSPAEKAFYCHRDTLRDHHERTLEILNPWMLDNITQENIQNIIVQIARFIKYSQRWEYTLSNKSFDKLIEVYNDHPNIVTNTNIVYNGSETYNGLSFIARQNQNVWEAIAPLLRAHSKWLSFKDQHGIISGKPVPLENSTTEQNTASGVLASEVVSDVPF